MILRKTVIVWNVEIRKCFMKMEARLLTSRRRSINTDDRDSLHWSTLQLRPTYIEGGYRRGHVMVHSDNPDSEKRGIAVSVVGVYIS